MTPAHPRRSRRGRPAAALLTLLALAAALPAAAAPAPPGPAAGRAPAWTSCVRGPDDDAGKRLEATGARCAEVTVPLDHTRPDGPALTLAVARIPATDRAHRIGTLVVNEGGPADPVVDYLPDRRAALGTVGARYDVVGIDPRFAGRNAPLDCGWPTGTYMRSAGTTRADFDRMAAFQRDLAARCHQGPTAALLPHASTRNAARDMDLVRAALGERRISYLGVSYGTYLGEVYAALFPGRLDRVVLDGVHEPHHLAPWPEYGTERVNEEALDDWARWTAAHHARYGLGRTPRQVRATVDAVVTAAAREPLAVGPYRIDRHVMPVLLYAVLGEDTAEADGQIADMMRTLKQAAESGPVEPDPGLAELLPALLTGRDSAYAGSQTAYLCADAPGPRDLQTHWRAVERSRARHPLFGPFVNDTTPCVFWTPPREPPADAPGDLPALLVNATGDPRVPYAEARALHARWPSSRLVTVAHSYRHAVYGLTYANACVNDTVNAYFADGRLPAGDLTCTAARP
ncbi:alpha/beta fold hydrolase [Streptomyces sp. NPDC049555]|uniref:alpha/beta hydrolase n=1 Tax=Streptomyces sp. NPDC049555 TaxID=3154930 RepID=UPI0034395CCF